MTTGRYSGISWPWQGYPVTVAGLRVVKKRKLTISSCHDHTCNAGPGLLVILKKPHAELKREMYHILKNFMSSMGGFASSLAKSGLKR